jgi:phosphoribosylaminoimidazole (AIR) synthetase
LRVAQRSRQSEIGNLKSSIRKAYARAGVDVDLGNRLKRKIHGLVRQTHGPEVLGTIGGFGGLFAPNFSGLREPVPITSESVRSDGINASSLSTCNRKSVPSARGIRTASA